MSKVSSDSMMNADMVVKSDGQSQDCKDSLSINPTSTVRGRIECETNLSLVTRGRFSGVGCLFSFFSLRQRKWTFLYAKEK